MFHIIVVRFNLIIMIQNIINVGVVELVDTPSSEGGGHYDRVGSNPTTDTTAPYPNKSRGSSLRSYMLSVRIRQGSLNGSVSQQEQRK